MFYGSFRFALLLLFTSCGFETVSNAANLTGLVQPLAKPVVPPLKRANSTFHADQRLPHPQRLLLVTPDLAQHQHVAKREGWTLDNPPAGRPQDPQPATNVDSSPANDPLNGQSADALRFQWKPAIAQAMTFLWIEHTFRFMTEPGTRAELRGPFFQDWFNSVRRTRGWRDGDPFIVNYVGHPMQGSVTNYIYVQNDPRGRQLEAGFSKAYFKSRLKAMLFSTIYSTQFELGPLGEAALGNVGLRPSQKSRHPSAFVDLVITPTLGTAWMMAEDTLDRVVVKRLEDHVENRFVRLMVRGFLNPSRSFANVLRGRWPWYRDGRRL